MACTGIEYCKLAIVETKALAARPRSTDLEHGTPRLRPPLTLHVNGCPNSCARIQIADIGLKGSIVARQPRARRSKGSRCTSAVHSDRRRFGRKPRGLKVTSKELPVFVERVARRFDEQRQGGETFAEWATRAEEADLS